jgi:hypothetical protein
MRRCAARATDQNPFPLDDIIRQALAQGPNFYGVCMPMSHIRVKCRT